jgi:hypothetical protein
MKRIVVLGVLTALATGLVLAVKFLPWWALLGGAVVLIVIGKWTVMKLLRMLFVTPFKMKGAVLKGATVELHSITPAEPPTTVEGEAVTARNNFWLEMTLTPTETSGEFQCWEPGELQLVKPESRVNPDSDEADDEDHSCIIRELQVQQEGQFAKDEGMKFPGEQRLRLLVAVEPGVTQLKFRYYFEEFGEVRLSAPSAGKAQAA